MLALAFSWKLYNACIGIYISCDLNKILFQELIMEIYNDVITRYLKIGAGQFLQDFFRDYYPKKSLALRKSLMLRRAKNQMKVHLAQIDRSPRKRSSQIRLLPLVNHVKEEISGLYKKP